MKIETKEKYVHGGHQITRIKTPYVNCWFIADKNKSAENIIEEWVNSDGKNNSYICDCSNDLYNNGKKMIMSDKQDRELFLDKYLNKN